MKIAFYAPLKPPGHPIPSGDRRMAELLMMALRRAGHDVELVSSLRSFMRDPDQFVTLKESCRTESVRLVQRWEETGGPPDAWFTYHPYYKAPDLLGPQICRAANIAYFTAEASYSARRDATGWQEPQSYVVDAVRLARSNFCFTPMDRAGLDAVAPRSSQTDLPPFIDAGGLCERTGHPSNRPAKLVTVAMMRPGDKLKSYLMLADAVQLLEPGSFSLTIVGDGSEQAAVHDAFRRIPGAPARFTGQCDAAGVAAQLAQADLFVWPGYGEAYGLAYLEAQACGLPVVAQNTKGVPYVVQDGVTGLLTQLDSVEAFANSIGKLIGDPPLYQRMSAAASRFARQQRTVDAAARILDEGLRRGVAASP